MSSTVLKRDLSLPSAKTRPRFGIKRAAIAAIAASASGPSVSRQASRMRPAASGLP